LNCHGDIYIPYSQTFHDFTKLNQICLQGKSKVNNGLWYQIWSLYLQLAGMVAEALDVTGTAHQTSIQGVTAFVWFICQLHPTVLQDTAVLTGYM